jgi:hypothetical protein
MCTIKNLPTTKANCDEFKHTIQNWMLCPHFPILSWIPWRTPEKTSISLGKFILLCSLGEKAIVELFCILVFQAIGVSFLREEMVHQHGSPHYSVGKCLE